MKSGELKKTANKATAINMIRTLFQYSTNSLHRLFELKASLCFSSIVLEFSNKLTKLGKKPELPKKIVYGHFFSVGTTRVTSSFRLSIRVAKIKPTLTAKPMAKDSSQFIFNILVSQVQSTTPTMNRTIWIQ